MKKGQILEFRYICLISILGFIVTGILMYPFGIHWDSANIFATQVYLENQGKYQPNNWMGWFYPYLWRGLYQITGIDHVIGVFHNVLYWLAMPILYVNLFKRDDIKRPSKKDNLYYVLFAFCPAAILFLMNITNNVLMFAFVIFALAMFVLHRNNGNIIFLLLALFCLFLAMFVRRDAFFLVFPISVMIFYVVSSRLYLSFIFSGVFLSLFFGLNILVSKNIADYNHGTYSTEVIALYDLVGMSYFKNVLLLPDEILDEKYIRENREKALQKIKNVDRKEIFLDVPTFQCNFNCIEEILRTKHHWKSGLRLEMAIPLYLNNILSYINFRSRLLQIYCLNGPNMQGLFNGFIYEDSIARTMNKDTYPDIKNLGFKEKIAYLVDKASLGIFNKGISFIAMFAIATYVLLSKKFKNIFSRDERLCVGLILLLGILSFAVAMVSVISAQFRYIMPSNMFIWMSFIYVIYRLLQYMSFSVKIEIPKTGSIFNRKSF